MNQEEIPNIIQEMIILNKPDSFEELSSLPADTVTTMAYVPFQTDKSMYEDDKALRRGTLYKNLDKPFMRGALK